MSIEQATAAVDEAAEDERRTRYREDAFYRMLGATDRLLWRLEGMNLDGTKTVPLRDVRRMRKSLAELPMSVESAFIENESVQEVLNGVFDVQDRLLAHYVPGYEPHADEEECAHESDPKRQERILRRVRECGRAILGDICAGFSGAEKDAIRAEIALMVNTGLLSVERFQSPNHRMLKRYFVAGRAP